LPFRWSRNPYHGCFHACAYCYARPTDEYWGFGAGTDFESKIIVKREAVALLRRTFEKPSWKGELILFSGNTDCYQPLEASLELTRACLEVCAEYRNPVGIITKGVLVLRLSGPVEPVFMERMAAAFPDRITKITNRIRNMRGGAMSEEAFFERHSGVGPYWAMIEQLFEVFSCKAGLVGLQDVAIPATFRRPGIEQTALF
jgi:DNA repair photolyase